MWKPPSRAGSISSLSSIPTSVSLVFIYCNVIFHLILAVGCSSVQAFCWQSSEFIHRGLYALSELILSALHTTECITLVVL